MLKRLPITELQPGMVIIAITEQHGPVKIKKSGLVTSNDMVQGLIEMGVTEVEVDPDQTVELEQPPQPQSKQTQTQALLQGHYDKQGHYDNQLADQFNRNLFLPSVQGIPSLWSVYLRQASAVVLTVLFGTGLGFFIAHPHMFAKNKPEQLVHTEALVEQVSANASGDAQKSVQVVEDDLEPVASTLTLKTASEKLQTTESLPSAEALVAQASDTSDEEEQGIEITRASQLDDAETVSPELLRKFNRVLEELDNEPNDDSEPVRVIKPNRDDVKRIDQLPVKYMTTLPSMDFTAHMYASREPDRWVRVNGQRLQEGDTISDDVEIISIEPQRVVLSYRGEVFSMAALTDW